MLVKLRTALVAAFASLCSLMSYADIADGHFGTNQIFDVQYYWSGSTLNASNFIAPYDANFQHPTVATGDYFAFFPSTTNPGTYGLGLYNSSGTLKQVVHNTGTLQAIGPDAIFYVGSGFFGTVITTSAGYAYGSSGTFSSMNRSVSSSDVSSYTWASTTPLSAGQTASNNTPSPTYVAITSASVVSVTPTSTNSPAGEGASNVIDGNSSTKYLNFDRASAGFTIKLNQGRVIEKFTITTANDYSPRDPSKFSLFGSNDGRTWTTIVSNQSITLSNSRYTTSSDITVNNTTAYVYYFITFDSTKALDLYPVMSTCMAAYGGGWLGTENCNSVQVSEVKYYYNSSNTTTSTDAGNGTIANPGTSGATSSLNTAPTVVSTAPGTSTSVVTETPGTTVTTSASTRGTTTDVTTYNNTRGERGTKELTIVRTTTVTSTTPVTTVVTNTTPVTITTVTTPTTVTTYSDGTTITTNDTPVTTVTTRNDVTTTTTVINDVQVVSTDQNYTTRIDQMDTLSAINNRINYSISADPLIRNSIVDNRIANRSWDDRDINAYIYGSRQEASSANGYTYRVDVDTFGAEHRINRSSLVGLQYNKVNATLFGTNGGGGLIKEALTIYGLAVKDDWILKGDIGQAVNNYNTYHTLPELSMSNSAVTKGEDFWVLAKVYTPPVKGFRPFVGIRSEHNNRNYVVESGSSLTAVDYSLINKTTETTEYGVRFEHEFNKNWTVAGEVAQNSKNLTTNDVALMYNAKNNSSMIVKLGYQRHDGITINVVQLQARLSF